MPDSYLIYHPKRNYGVYGGHHVHHDRLFVGNEDPYIWNDRFLHTYCHITQMKNEVGQINFWVGSDNFSQLNNLWCDCVFVVDEVSYWANRNFIAPTDKIVDSPEAFQYHYQWAAKGQHTFTRRERYTAKANSEHSFQPQDSNGNLIDVIPFLNRHAINTSALKVGLTAGVGSKPLKLPDTIGQLLYQYLSITAKIKLLGRDIANYHP